MGLRVKSSRPIPISPSETLKNIMLYVNYTLFSFQYNKSNAEKTGKAPSLYMLAS